MRTFLCCLSICAWSAPIDAVLVSKYLFSKNPSKPTKSTKPNVTLFGEVHIPSREDINQLNEMATWVKKKASNKRCTLLIEEPPQGEGEPKVTRNLFEKLADEDLPNLEMCNIEIRQYISAALYMLENRVVEGLYINRAEMQLECVSIEQVEQEFKELKITVKELMNDSIDFGYLEQLFNEWKQKIERYVPEAKLLREVIEGTTPEQALELRKDLLYATNDLFDFNLLDHIKKAYAKKREVIVIAGDAHIYNVNELLKKDKFKRQAYTQGRGHEHALLASDINSITIHKESNCNVTNNNFLQKMLFSSLVLIAGVVVLRYSLLGREYEDAPALEQEE